jgi:hypothetical protein
LCQAAGGTGALVTPIPVAKAAKFGMVY